MKHILDMTGREALNELLDGIEYVTDRVLNHGRKIYVDSSTARRWVDLLKLSKKRWDVGELPELHNCDRGGCIMAWSIEDKRWDIVSLLEYLSHREAYKTWMPLPGDVE